MSTRLLEKEVYKEGIKMGNSSILIHGDCLEEMPFLADGLIDMVLVDMPYGLTKCKWDSVIPLDLIWEQVKRLIKPNGAIVMTASQPFTSVLISSNIKAFKYEWIWHKSRHTGFLQAKFMPMKAHENICVFCFKGVPVYNPQKTEGHKPTNRAYGVGHSPTFGASKNREYDGGETSRYPKTIQAFKSERGLHPTQKPVTLMEYLIKTYTNEQDTVLDFCMGSGTTGVACKNLNRDFIGIELDKEYFDTAKKRIDSSTTIVIT